MGMKFFVQDGRWEIFPKKFLDDFSHPGNAEHELWANLCKMALQRGEDPLMVTVQDLEAESAMGFAEIEKLLQASELNGFSCRKMGRENDR